MKLECIYVLGFLQISTNLAWASQEPACPDAAPSLQQIVEVPSAVVGRHYSRRLITGGEPPYTFTFEAGSPEEVGLSLNADGFLAGVPVRRGFHTFTVAVQDRRGCTPLRQTYRIRVIQSQGG